MTWIFLDSDPTGLACRKAGNREADDFRAWLFGQKGSSMRVVVPEIVDYEDRRELIRTKAWDRVRRLDNLSALEVAPLLPINSAAMQKAAGLWAEARDKGQPTANDRSLDGDAMLAAQAIGFCSDADDWMILTENVGHIERYVGDRARSRRAVVAAWLSSPQGRF